MAGKALGSELGSPYAVPCVLILAWLVAACGALPRVARQRITVDATEPAPSAAS